MNKRINRNHSGFTLVELLLVVSIIMLLIAGAAPLLGTFFTSTQLNESTSQTKQMVQTARQRALSGMNDSNHGVFFEHNVGTDDRLILYQGSSYATRNTLYDYSITLDAAVSYSTTLPGDEINYDSGTGAPSSTGTVSLEHETRGTSQLLINAVGVVLEN